MLITVTQSEMPHDVNRLHDFLITAGFAPWPVESTKEESRFYFDDTADETAIRAAIEAFKPKEVVPPPTSGDIIAALASIDLKKVETLADMKAAIAPAIQAAVSVVESAPN
jgi:hypothetical protein